MADLMVRVSKKELIDTLTANMERHIQEYEEAMEARNIEILSVLSTLCDEIKCGYRPTLKDVSDTFESPHNYSSCYKDAIELFEMSVEDSIKLDMKSFKQFFKDQWQWTHQFAAASGKYRR